MASGAAAALLAKALPKASGSGSSAAGGSSAGGRTSRSGRGKGVRGAGAAHADEDVGMSDGNEGAAARRRGRQGRNGPMGERPTRGGGRNAPGVISDKPTRASSAPTSSKAGKSSDPPTQSTIDVLRLFLLSRYSQPDRMLNLESMSDDPILKQHKLLAPGQPGAPTNMAGAIWKLSKELFPDVVSLSLANNNLSSLLPLSPYLLTSSLPHIENVSFANNNIKNFRDLDPFSPLVGKERKDKQPKGWGQLKELVLTGNPVVGSGGQPETYAREMARRFATLRTLDQKPLDPSIAFTAGQERPNPTDGPGLSSRAKSEKAKAAKREPVVFPVDITKGGFFESDGARDFVGQFFLKFFDAFDNDRPSLLPVYAPICTFSLHADTANPVRARAKKVGTKGDRRFPNQHKLDWNVYLTAEGSRNLVRVRNPEKRVATLKVTPSSIITTIVALPKTKHPLEEANKFVWDSWTMPNMLAPPQPGAEGETVIFASVHGEFTEFPSKGVRSFDRTFILAPAPPGSPAAAAGWPCIVLSDLLTLRGYSDLAFSKPRVPRPPKDAPAAAAPPVGVVDLAAAAAAGVVPGAVPVAGQERAEGITDEQQSLVLQLQAVTRLTYAFAHLCLAQNAWDPHQALAQFQGLQAQGSIPAEAFLPV
ncbi:nuclear mRNA export, poly(A)+RNA binding protein [Rhodotorula kratochvilovae]